MMVVSLREWLAAEPFTLAMSSGFFGFFAHAGFLAVLEEEGLLPARVCGSSAGALVAALWASGLPARRICEELILLRREHFWDVRPGFGLLRGQLFRARIERLLPVKAFADCRVPLAVSVFDVRTRRTTVLRVGEVASAVHASCAAPIMFQPVRIGSRLYLDGGILDRPGVAGAEPGGRLLFHHLPSRSPWRRPGSSSLKVPDLPNMQVVAVDGLPRVNPFRLERGLQAMEGAERGTRLALSLQVAP